MIEADTPIQFRIEHSADGQRVYLASSGWPRLTRIATGLLKLKSRHLGVAGDTVTFTPENGAAVYTKIGEADGYWLCRLEPGSTLKPLTEAA
jgi:hypothetical protein